MLSVLTLKHLWCPAGPMLGAFVRVKFYLISFKSHCHFTSRKYVPFHVLENLRVTDPGAPQSNSWWAPVFCAAPKEGATKPLPQRGCHGPRGLSPGQVCSYLLLPNFYWTDTASLPQPAWPADLWPSAHQYLCILVKMENCLRELLCQYQWEAMPTLARAVF